MLYRVYSLFYNEISMYIRIIENKILRRVVHDILIKEPVLLIQLSRACLIVRDYKPHLTVAHAKNKVCLLLLDTPCHKYSLTCLIQISLHILKDREVL